MLRVHEYVTADPTCFGSRDVTLTAWLGALPAMGWEGPGIEPGWLIYPPNFEMSALWQRGPGGEPMCGDDPDCALLVVHLRPETTIVLGQSPRWVVATGHVRDPLSTACRFDLGDDWPDAEPTPDNAVAREECSSQFVLTSLRDGDAPAEP